MVDTPMIPGARPAAPQYLSRVFIGDRSELPNDDRGRRIALDFNAGGGRGVELIVPKDITAEETELSEAYVNGVQKLFQDYGYEDYPVRTSEFRRGVKRKGRENSSGISNTFHTEPFFIEDEKARGIFMDPAFQKQYASLLDATLRKIPNSTVLAPHGVGADEGAVFQHDGAKVTERSAWPSSSNWPPAKRQPLRPRSPVSKPTQSLPSSLPTRPSSPSASTTTSPPTTVLARS